MHAIANKNKSPIEKTETYAAEGKFPAVVVSNSRFCAGGATGRRPPFRCRRHLSNTPEGEGGV
eukprot:scaffold85759_cov39-Phaeocystis_antarctica.AAC.2